eukprot:g18183.t1
MQCFLHFAYSGDSEDVASPGPLDFRAEGAQPSTEGVHEPERPAAGSNLASARLLVPSPCTATGSSLAGATENESPLRHLLDIAEIQFAQKVDDMLKRMTEAGMKADRFVLMGHSLGAVGCQLYLTGSGHGKFDALILTGSTILRRYRNSSLPPTLTLDGDLDGLLRVSRQAEAYFHQVERAGAQERRTMDQ